jgi:hypothetical protein
VEVESQVAVGEGREHRGDRPEADRPGREVDRIRILRARRVRLEPAELAQTRQHRAVEVAEQVLAPWKEDLFGREGPTNGVDDTPNASLDFGGLDASVDAGIGCVSVSGIGAFWMADGDVRDVVSGVDALAVAAELDAGVSSMAYRAGVVREAFRFSEESATLDAEADGAGLTSDWSSSVWLEGTMLGDETVFALATRDDASQRDAGLDRSASMTLGVDASGTLILTWHEAGAPVVELIVPEAVEVDAWAHVAISVEAGILVLYLDGMAVADAVLFDGPPSFASGGMELSLGRGLSTDLRMPFTGALDEFVIFDRALDEAEIASIVDARSAGICSP